MKVLVASINFAPDHSGIAIYSTDLPVYLAEQGLQSTVVTGFSYYPSWRKQPADVGRLFKTEEYRGVRVLRGYLYVPGRVTTFRRIIHEISFLVFAFLNFFRAGRQDYIVVLSPPLLLGLVGVIFKWLWRCELVFHIQDLQLDAALSLGMVKAGVMTRILLRCESFIYRKSSWIATISKGMRDRILAKGVPEKKVALFHNWIHVDEASNLGTPNRFREQFPEHAGKFLVAYAGNLGVKQGVDVLLDVAAAMCDRGDVHFFIIGEGADKPRLLEIAAQRGLRNVTFMPLIAENEYFDMLEDVNASFVSQRSGTGNVFFPSKLLGIMAKGKPVLISADCDSELSCVVREAECGITAAVGDVDTIVRGITLLASDADVAHTFGKNGAKFVRQFDRGVVLRGFLEHMLNGSEEAFVKKRP